MNDSNDKTPKSLTAIHEAQYGRALYIYVAEAVPSRGRLAVFRDRILLGTTALYYAFHALFK